MKKLISVFAILSSASLLATSAFADVSASSTVDWKATAVKDTHSMLVVTALKPLNFQYAEGIKQFNSQDGAFDVTIQGQNGATDFNLTSKIINNTLTRTDNASTLAVGVSWYGQKLTKNSTVTLINTATNINNGLAALAQSSAYAGANRASAQGNFNFTIDGATSNGTTVAQYEDLLDGSWDGLVSVQFTANWVKP